MSPQMESSVQIKDKNEYQPKINSIRKVIYAEDKRIREKYSFLEHQNTIGMIIFTSTLLSMILTSYLYISGFLVWYLTIPLMAIFISFLHELEHDLIHDLYFKEMKFIQNIMLAFIWVSKINANPWWRKAMHLKHHKTSGQMDDIEERLIGLGLPLGLKRFLITISPLGSYLVIYSVAQDSKKMNSLPGVDLLRASIVNLPVLLPGNLCLLAILFPEYVSSTFYMIAWNICMLLYFPNTLRQSSLQWVSTGCHYFGDIPRNNVFFQNQVLNHWIFYPFQLFCFNFGATHIIHHYVTRQPFYLRQLVAAGVLDEFKKQGVRFNDLQIYQRAHRYYDSLVENNPPPLSIGA